MKHTPAIKSEKLRRGTKAGRCPRLIYLATIASGDQPGLADFAPSGRGACEAGPDSSDTTLVVVHEQRGKIISHIYSPVLSARSACAARTRRHFFPLPVKHHAVSSQPRS